MTHVRIAVAVLFLLSIASFSAAAEETIQTRQNPLYAVVLQESAGDYEPDYEALGGTIERRWKHRAFVSLPQSAVDVLLVDAQVKFIQRVYTGDPLPGVPLQPRKQGEREIRTEWEAPTWFSGYYNYDGAGNIKSIDRQGVSGTDGQIDRYAYDLAGRILYGTVNGPSNYEDYKYDSFGNLVRTQSSARPTMAAPASLSTNRLEGAGYDQGGNLTTPAGTTEKFIYDSFSMIRAKARPNMAIELYLYTADDERLAVDTLGITTWMIRDLGGKVLREWHGWGAPDAWFWEQDYIYREGQLVAAERQSVEGGTRHFHADHLGTPRLITNQLGQKMATHDYFPFGVELTDFRQEMTERGLPRPEPMKFTGHERDFTGGTTANHLDYIDYMHGRYYDPIRGRFPSVDPVLDIKEALYEPQLWNRYSYVTNNPLKFTDDDGRYRTFYKEKAMTSANMVMDDDTPAVVKGAFYAQAGLLTLAAGGPLRNLAFEASLLLMRHPAVILAAYKLLDSLGGNVSGHINPTGQTGGKLGFLLGEVASQKSIGRGGFFAGVMGFTAKTLDGAIRTHFADNVQNAVLQKDGRLAVTGAMMGANGVVATVKTVWQWNKDKKVWDLITAVPAK